MKHLLRYVFMCSDSAWLSAFFIICQVQVYNWKGVGLPTQLFDELIFWQMKGKHFLKSCSQSLGTVALSWCQSMLRTVTCPARVTNRAPLIGRVPKPCGMWRDWQKIVAEFLTQHRGLTAGWVLLPCVSGPLSHRKGGWEAAHNR